MYVATITSLHEIKNLFVVYLCVATICDTARNRDIFVSYLSRSVISKESDQVIEAVHYSYVCEIEKKMLCTIVMTSIQSAHFLMSIHVSAIPYKERLSS